MLHSGLDLHLFFILPLGATTITTWIPFFYFRKTRKKKESNDHFQLVLHLQPTATLYTLYKHWHRHHLLSGSSPKCLTARATVDWTSFLRWPTLQSARHPNVHKRNILLSTRRVSPIQQEGISLCCISLFETVQHQIWERRRSITGRTKEESEGGERGIK